MKSAFGTLLLVLALGSGCGKDGAREAPEAPKDAPELFASLQLGEKTYDPAVADLYCDNAVIRNTRRYPGGRVRLLEIPAEEYKALIKETMPLAKARGDISTYSNISYTIEGDNTRITATRYSQLKDYSSPHSLLVGPCDGMAVGIIEETGESQP